MIHPFKGLELIIIVYLWIIFSNYFYWLYTTHAVHLSLSLFFIRYIVKMSRAYGKTTPVAQQKPTEPEFIPKERSKEELRHW